MVADDTARDERIATDLIRADRSNLPVNLIYPPNYPAEPAVMLPEIHGPKEALIALDRMEEILQYIGDTRDTQPSPVPRP